MKRSIAILALVTLALTLPNEPVAAKDAKLTFAPVNKSLHYALSIEREVYVQGFEIVTNFTGNVDITWVEKTEDGKSKLSIKFTNIEGTRRQGDDLIDQDLGINNLVVDVTVSERGEVDDVQPQKYLDESITMMVQDMVEKLIAYMPEKAVGKGDRWVQERLRPGASPDDPPTVKGQVEYFLDDLKKDGGREVAKITGEGKADINFPTPAGLLIGTAKSDVDYVIALDGGYMIKSKSTTEVKGEMGKGQELSQVQRFECELK